MQSTYYMLLLIASSLSSRILKTEPSKNPLYKGQCSSYINIISGYECTQSKNIGTNNRSIVFLIRDSSGTKFAMKVQEKSEKTLKEAKVLKELKGQRFIIDLVQDEIFEDIHIFILEYAPNKNLEIVLQTSDYFSDMNRTLIFFSELIEGLKAIHKHGYVHCKFSLENIVLTEDYEPRIIDFNAVEEMNKEDYFKGIPIYMSPELVNAYDKKEKIVYNEAIDIYAAGIVLYYMQMHTFPLTDYNMEYMKMINSDIVFYEGTSTLFMNIIIKCLQLEKKRYSTAELLKFLKNNIEHYEDSPLINGYYYSMAKDNLKIFKSTVSNNKYYTLCILLAAVLIFSATIIICYFQVCLFLVWSKTDTERVSMPPSETNIDKRFIDSVGVSRIKRASQDDPRR